MHTLKLLGGGNDTTTSLKPQNFLELTDEKSYLNPTRGGKTTSIENSEELANILNERMKSKSGGNNQRLAIMLGWLTKSKEEPIKANIPESDRSNFAMTKWKFMLDAPFEISNKCCTVMKKEPSHRYNKMTGRHPMTAQMASESRLRTQKWLQNGCNGFDLKEPISNPMSFWTDQDVLLYIRQHNLRICSVYGEVVTDDEELGQLNFNDIAGMEMFDLGNPTLHTTGCDRTGCMLCGFGAMCEKKENSRFLRLKETHPGMYALMDKTENNGVTYREAVEWINQHLKGKGHIWL